MIKLRVPFRFATFFPRSQFLFGLALVILTIRFNGIVAFTFGGHGERKRCQSSGWKLVCRGCILPQIRRHLKRLVFFLGRMVVAVLPLLVHGLHQIQRPHIILQRRPHPHRHGMILVRNLVYLDVLIDFIGWIYHLNGCTQHLHGFQNDLDDVLVEHKLGAFTHIPREDEQVHSYIDASRLENTLFQF